MLLMKLISTFFISVVFLILDLTSEKNVEKQSFPCFSESINSYMAKLQQNILLESEKIRPEKILELKPLYDYAISVYKLKMAKTRDYTQLQSQMQNFNDQISNLDDSYFVNVSENFLKKFSKNLETEDDYAELVGTLQKKFLDYKTSKSEMKIVSTLLSYDFQLVFLNALQAEKKSLCLPADFDYLITLNKYFAAEAPEATENNNNPSLLGEEQEKNKVPMPNTHTELTQIQSLEGSSFDYNYNSELGREIGVVLNADDLGNAYALSSGLDGITVEYLRRNGISVKSKKEKKTENNLAFKKTKQENPSLSKYSSKNILNLKDFKINESKMEHSFSELLNSAERTTFYFIFAESLELFASQSEAEPSYVFVEASHSNVFYEVTKKETSGKIAFEHTINVYNQKFQFIHESNCDQYVHVFLTLDDSFNQLKLVLNVRFTKTFEYNFSKIFVVNLAEELASEELRENMFLVFNSYLVSSVNTFKNFNFSYAEQISVIYKVNRILLWAQANNLSSLELKNVLSNELIGFNNAKYEFEDRLYGFTKYLLERKSENLNRINSRFLHTSHFPGFYSFTAYFLDSDSNSSSNINSNNNAEKQEESKCNYVNEFKRCLRCAESKKFFNYQCWDECPENAFYSSESNNWIKCGKGCKKCRSDGTCAECKSGFFLNSADGVCMDYCPADTNLVKKANGSLYCESCDENCNLCDSKSNKCLKCKGNAFLTQEGACVRNCPDKFYSDTITKTCVKFEVSNCKVPAKNSILNSKKAKCEECESGFYKQASLCKTQCDSGFYAYEAKDSKVCKKCPSECAECAYDSVNQKPLCTKCNLKTHKELKSNDNSNKNLICENLCAENNTILVDSVCVKCDIDNCNKCSLDSENNNNNLVCEKCQEGFLLKNGKCVAECGSGFYSSEFNSACAPCAENCNSCLIKEETQSLVCDKCKDGFYLLHNSLCIDECPEGYAKSLLATESQSLIKQNNQNDNLNLNNNTDNNNTNIQTSSDLDNLRKTALKQNPQRECKICENSSSCRRCSGQNPAVCEDCYEGYFNNNGVCQHKCPKGFYKANKQCVKCTLGCELCSNENSCMQCSQGFFYKNGECTPDCGAGWAPDVYSNSCKKCFDSRCSECFAFDENLCQKCLSGFKLFENVCYSKCPLGYFDSNGFCNKCTKGCLDCDSSQSCKKCDPNRSLVLLDNKCVETCPLGYYKDYQSNVCKQCANKDCLLCDSAEPSECKVAKSGTVIENTYYDKCPENFIAAFVNVQINNEKFELLNCFKCPLFCDACEFNPVNSKIQCLKCAGNFELRNGSCIDKWCDENKIKIDNGCFTCPDKNAKKCDDVKPYRSIECKTGFYLNEGKCVGSCPEGKYNSKAFLECKDCVYNCSECRDYNFCDKCDEGFLLFENSKCVKQCPNGFSEDYVSGKCVKCADNCSECDVDSLACKKCRMPFLNELGKCTLKCRLGFFENKEESVCEKCSDCNCLKCRENGKECVECKGDLLIESGRCVKSCDKASGYQQIGRRCEKCLVENCENCDKKATNICKKCLSNFYLTEDNQCIPNCPEGFFINNFNQKCSKCPSNCVTCDSNGNCTKCEADKILFESRCIFNCPQGFKKNRNGEGKLICDKCNENCKSCNESNTCFECEQGFLLNKSNNKCENKCALGNYMMNGNCVPCGDNCQKCDDKENCSLCKEGFYFNNQKKCVNKCPNGSVLINEKCVQCKTLHAKCVKCSENALDKCVACADGFYLLNNQCVEICPQGYFRNDLNKCQKCSENCLDCLDETTCKFCFDGFYLIDQDGQKQCFDSCPSKTYLNKATKNCDRCSENCLYCVSDRFCKKCKSEFLLENGECKSLCSKGFFTDEFGKCEKCESGCLSCKSKSQCLICQEGLALKDGLCVDNCGINYTNFNNQGICVKCDPNCAECNKFNSSICRKCYENKVLLNGSCVDKCPLGYTEHSIEIPESERMNPSSNVQRLNDRKIKFFTRLTSLVILNKINNKNNIYVKNNNAKKATDIVKALQRSFAKISKRNVSNSNESVNQYPYNFALSNYKICKKCGKGCEMCSSENSYECLQCEEPLALQNGECRDTCANNDSSVMIEGYCTQCDQIHESLDNCAKCEATQINPNRKTSKNEKIKSQILQSMKGLKPKSGLVSSYSNSISNNKTLNLFENKNYRISSISELKAVYEISCTECKKNYYLNYIDNKCVKECPLQTFKTKTSSGKLVCDICPEGCKSCNSSLNCTECYEGLKINSIGLCDHTAGCQDEKMFYSFKFKKCLKCELENCIKCDGHSVEQKCKLCKTGFYLDLKNKICVKNCPKETYFNQEKNHCSQCPENCSLCDNNKQCKKCLDGFLFEDGFCVERCSENYVEKDFTCQRCEDKNCKICDRNDLSKCEVCDQNYKLENGECKTLCSNGFYQEVISEENVQCKPCGDNCDTCLDDKTCLKCLNFKITSNRMLNLFDFNKHQFKYINLEQGGSSKTNKIISRRVVDRNSKMNQHSSNKQNQPSEYLNLLNGADNKNSNSNQNILYNIKYFLKNNFCVRDCGENYAHDYINQICRRCADPNCLKCSPDSEQTCEACKANFFLANGKCHSSCPQGFFMNTVKNSCEKCNSDFCLACKNAQVCDKCKSPKVLLDGYCLDERCPSGFLNVNGSCEKCQVDNCESCSQDLTQCYKCKHNFSLVKQKNICVPSNDCPESYYFNREQKQCERCPDSNCLECLPENPSTCVNCNLITTLVDKKCESRCQKTFVFVDKKGKCIECDQDLKATCLVCDPLNLKRCLRCDQQQPLKYLFKGKCFEVCPAKSFWDKITNECTECPKNCDECSNEYACNKCQVGFYLNENKECVKACLDGFIVNDNNVCEKCQTEKQCKICDLKDKSKCIECKNGLFIDLANNKCVEMCPEGTLVSGSSCLSCGSDCSECESFDKCKTCKDGFVLYEGKCIEKCPLGFVTDLSTMHCIPCTINDCVSCSNDQSKCFKCKEGKALYKNACVDVCPQGTVDNDKNGYCIDCPPKCSACDNSNSCKQCISPYTLDKNNLCSLNDCPIGSTMRDNKCVKCGDEKCRICDSDNVNACFSCMQDSFLLKDSCVIKCPDGYYQNDKTHKCLECISNCLTCDEAGKCITCRDGFFNLKSTSCIRCADLGYSLAANGKDCIPCKVNNCLKCNSESDSICRTCQKGFYLTEDGQCLNNCPLNYFKSESEGVPKCLQCGSGCLKCDSKTSCIECDKGFILDSGFCSKKCPINNYEFNGKCLECKDKNCLYCLSEDSGKTCIKCKQGTNLFNGECRNDCPEGFYSDISGETAICRECAENCLKCQAFGDSKSGAQCQQCDEGFNLIDNKCVSKCGPNKFENKEKNGKCDDCNDENCLVCLSADNCRKCNKYTFLYIKGDENACLHECPIGYYKNKKNRRCDKCKENCKVCANGDSCITCNDRFYLFDKKCVSNCPEGYGIIERSCQKCTDENCLRCKENDNTKCNECVPGKFLIHDICVDADYCYRYSRFPDKAKRKCRRCDGKCQVCLDRKTCLECFDEFKSRTKIKKMSEVTGTFLPTEINYYDKQYKITDKNNSNSEANIEYYDCFNPCPDNKVMDLDTKSCVCCRDPTCKDCINKGEKCLSCFGQASLLDGNCLKNCPASYFKDSDKGRCSKCPNGCEVCTNSEQCSRCASGYFLNEDGKCNKYCPDKFYSDADLRKCLSCDPACEVCWDHYNKNCFLCAEGFFKLKNKCIKKGECPKGTFVNLETRECSACGIANCDECSDKNKCNVCNENYTISNDASQCIANLKFVNVIDEPNMYSKYQIENKLSKTNQTLTGDFRISCEDPRSFSVSFWTRVITDDIRDESVIAEISHPFYEEYFKQNKNLKYDNEKFSYPGFYVNLKIKRVEVISETQKNNKIEGNSKNNINDDVNLYNRANGDVRNLHESNTRKPLKISELKNLQKLKRLRSGEKDKDKDTLVDIISDDFKNNQKKIIKYKCVSEIIYLTNQNEIKKNLIENDYCDFLMLKEWTMTVLSVKLVGDEKLTFKLSLYDSVLQYDYNTTSTINDKFYFEKEINIISASTFITLDRQYALSKVPIFEISKFKIHEFPLAEKELSDLHKTKPLSCDVNCVKCENDVCLQCKNNKVNPDGYCEPVYLPINNNLLELDKPQSYILSGLTNNLLYKYISSDRYTFITFFNINSKELTMDRKETLLFKLFYYNGVNLVEVKLIGNELVIIINGKFEKAQGFELQLDSWYGINISSSKDAFYVIIRDEQNEDLINISQSIEGNEYLMRLTHDAEFYFYGGKTNTTHVECDWAIQKTLIYINNIYLDLPKFSCAANCAKCDKKLQCVFCEGGYVLNKDGKGCKLEENLNPIMQLKRNSLYDYEEEIIDYPNELGLKSITMSCWMRKTLPSRAGTKTNILNFMDPVSEEVYPIMSQEVDQNGVTMYKIDLNTIAGNANKDSDSVASGNLNLNNQKGKFDRTKEEFKISNDNNKNYIAKTNQQNQTYQNITLFKNNLDLGKTQKTFEYSVKYENNTFNYIHIGINILRINETSEFIITFALYDPYAGKNFTTRLNMGQQFMNMSEFRIGDKLRQDINMAYGPIRYYKGNTLKDPQLYNRLLTQTVPKSCEASCRECDYNTGNCLLCATTKITSTQCDTLMFGFTKSMNYNNTKHNHPLKISQFEHNHEEKLNSMRLNRKFRKSQYNSLMTYSNVQNDEQNGNGGNTQNLKNAGANISVSDREKVEKDQDFSTSFNEFFEVDMNSMVYSVLGWVYIIAPPNKGKENIIYRLSNCDYGNMFREDDKDYLYDSGLNLITLKAKFIDDSNKPEFAFVLGDGQKDVEIPTGVEVLTDTWYFVYSGKNVTGMFFDYSISQNSETFFNTKRFDLGYVSQPIQEITTLKLFGVDSVSKSNSEFARAVAYNFYMIPNIRDPQNTMRDFQSKIDPTKPNVFSKCNYACDPGSCVLDTCFKCKPGFQLTNEHCVKIESSNTYSVLIDQKNMNRGKHLLAIDPILTVNGSYAFQFYVRRNYHPRFTVLENDVVNDINNSSSIVNNKKNFDVDAGREIIKFGNFKLSYLNSLNGVRMNLDIESPSFASYKKTHNITSEITLYQSDDNLDFEWHFVQVFINRTSIIVSAAQINSDTFYTDASTIVIPHNNLVKEDFRELLVDALDHEITIYGFIFFQADKKIETHALQKPHVDCPIDCTLCDAYPNNICLKCDYGNQCTLNNAKDNLCKFRFLNLPSFYIWNFSPESQNQYLANRVLQSTPDREGDQNTNSLVEKNKSDEQFNEDSFDNQEVFTNFFTQKKQDEFVKNYVKLSELYGHLLNKVIRFRSFTLTFIVSIDLSQQYDSIVKILNYNKETSSNYLSSFGEYEFMNLRFDTTQRLFMFNYSNKNTIRSGDQDSNAFTIKGYKSKSNLNQYHYVAISYNEVQRLFSFVILNSKDNYIIDNLSTNGNMDFLGTYSHLIFGDGFKQANKGKNAETKIFEVKFMHETALNTIELINGLQKNFDINYIHGCKNLDIRSNVCLRCDEGLEPVGGLCHINGVKNLNVKVANQAIDNYIRPHSDIILDSDPNDKTNIFAIQFMFLQLKNQPKLSGLLKFSKVKVKDEDRIKGARNIIQVLERENGLIFIFSPFTDPNNSVYFFVDNLYKIDESYSWLHITITVNLSLKSFNVNIYNYKTLEIKTHKFEYLKQYERFETNKDFNVLARNSSTEKFAFRFSFTNERVTIANGERNLVFNESAEHVIKYKMSTFVFYTGKELEASSIRKILPLRPVTCVCACQCINEVCPKNCLFDPIWIKYDQDKDVVDKSLLFKNFFKIIENSSRKYPQENSDKNNIFDLSDYERVSKDNYFSKASISFKIDFKRFRDYQNKWISILFKIPFFVEHIKANYNLDKYMPDLLKSKKNPEEFDFSYNEATREFLKVLGKAITVKSFYEKIKEYVKENKPFIMESGLNGKNLKYIFILSDDLEVSELQPGDFILKKMVKDSILTMQADFGKLTIFIGGNKFSDTVYMQELDFQAQNSMLRLQDEDLLKLEQIYVYFNIDMKTNLLKVVLFLNDMRKDFEFKFPHRTDYISYFSSIFVNPSVQDLIINVGETSISRHLREIRRKIISSKFKQKFCSDYCSDCFVGSKKYLRKCLVCAEGKSMYNSNCMKGKNIALLPKFRKFQNSKAKKSSFLKNRRN